MSLSSAEDSGPPSSSPQNRIRALLASEGFMHFGFAELTRPASIGLYEQWLSKGYQGEMTYLDRHLPEKRDPTRLLDKARSAIVVTENYVPHPEPIENFPLSRETRVAAYARGRDYHHFLKARLSRVVAALKALWPEQEFAVFTDSAPVLERDLAARAGLGWIGKNNCLIDRRRGSLFFIAEIYTTLQLETAQLSTHDHCGTCTRCLEACPTGALKGPRELDARFCISYLTIEARSVPDEKLRHQIGDWLFGCDICQTVCPWNIKAHGRETLSKLEPSRDGRRSSHIDDLRFLLTSSNRQLERAFAGSPLLRTGAIGLKRNALIVAANGQARELQPEIENLTIHEKLGSLARWALARLANPQENP